MIKWFSAQRYGVFQHKFTEMSFAESKTRAFFCFLSSFRSFFVPFRTVLGARSGEKRWQGFFPITIFVLCPSTISVPLWVLLLRLFSHSSNPPEGPGQATASHWWESIRSCTWHWHLHSLQPASATTTLGRGQEPLHTLPWHRYCRRCHSFFHLENDISKESRINSA